MLRVARVLYWGGTLAGVYVAAYSVTHGPWLDRVAGFTAGALLLSASLVVADKVMIRSATVHTLSAVRENRVARSAFYRAYCSPQPGFGWVITHSKALAYAAAGIPAPEARLIEFGGGEPPTVESLHLLAAFAEPSTR